MSEIPKSQSPSPAGANVANRTSENPLEKSTILSGQYSGKLIDSLLTTVERAEKAGVRTAIMVTDRYTDEGLRVVLAEDWFIYVVRESDNLMFQYVTELWYEWGNVCEHCYLGEQSTCTARPGGHSVADLIPYAHDHTPRPILSDSGVHMTLEKFLAADYA